MLRLTGAFVVFIYFKRMGYFFKILPKYLKKLRLGETFVIEP